MKRAILYFAINNVSPSVQSIPFVSVIILIRGTSRYHEIETIHIFRLIRPSSGVMKLRNTEFVGVCFMKVRKGPERGSKHVLNTQQ